MILLALAIWVILVVLGVVAILASRNNPTW